MKVRCIDAGPKQNLTVGKVYTVENEFGGLYTIKNDANGVGEYYKRRFEPVDEVAPELNIDMEEIIEVELKKEEVKSMRSLRERVLGKVDYKSIAEQIWDRLEDDGTRYFLIKNDKGKNVEYFDTRFEIVNEVAPELNIDMEEIIEVELKKEEVKSMRSLRERVLGKVNYKSIAEQIWDRLEDEIIEEISYSLDEDSIVDDMIHHYKSDYIDVAKEVLIEEFCQDISSDEIEDHIKEIAREKAYE